MEFGLVPGLAGQAAERQKAVPVTHQAAAFDPALSPYLILIAGRD